MTEYHGVLFYYFTIIGILECLVYIYIHLRSPDLHQVVSWKNLQLVKGIIMLTTKHLSDVELVIFYQLQLCK